MNRLCPRCRSPQTALMARSPVAGMWEMHLCGTCYFAWRTTEPDATIDPDRYDVRFRLTPESIAAFAEVPAVPPAARATARRGKPR